MKRIKHSNPHHYASVCRSLHSSEQVVIRRVRCYSERTVDNPAVDMDSEIHTQHISVLQYDVLTSRIGSPVSSHIVYTESSRKPHAGFESVACLNTLVAGQRTNAIFNFLG